MQADIAKRAHKRIISENGLSASYENPKADFCFIRVADNLKRMKPDEQVRALLALGMTQEQIAARLGVSQSTVNRWSQGQSDPKGANRDALRALHQEAVEKSKSDSPSRLNTAHLSGVVHIIGKAGAGPNGEVAFDEANGSLGEVPAPRNATETTVALEVEGNSMRGIANDGWLVFYDDRRDPVSVEMIGELCVVGLEDGRTLVKFIAPGRAPGLYDLESVNAETMRDVPVRWAAFVTDIVPRRTARAMMRRDASIGIHTAKAN